MRYVLAITALAISGVLLLLGLGQRTFLAGPVEIVHTMTFDSDAKYAVIDAEELTKVVGQANIVMRGNTGFAAVAKTRDIDGWLAPFGHEQVEVSSASKETTSSHVNAEAPTNDLLEVDDDGNVIPLDPRGSDLWLDSRDGGDGVFRLPVSLSENQSILIAGNGEDPIPNGASIAWVQDRNTPWAGPLLAGGAAFALIGAVLYLLAFDRDKRALGPRRGRKGPLLGVRNVVGGIGRKKASSDAAVEPPKQGGMSDAPALDEAQTDAAADEHATGADTGEIVIEGVEDGAEGEAHADPEEIVVEEVDEADEVDETTPGDSDAKGDDDAK